VENAANFLQEIRPSGS